MSRIIAFGMAMLLLIVNDESTMSKINKIKKCMTRRIELKETKTRGYRFESQMNETDYAIMWAYSK